MTSTIRASLSGIATAALLATGFAAAQDAIATRKGFMKANGAAAKGAGDMVKGTVPFDAAKAKAHMESIASGMGEFPKHFPKGSDSGETRASPAIWQKFESFEANAKKLVADAKTAAEAAAQGPDAFKGAFGEVAKNCVGCHEAFRVERK